MLTGLIPGDGALQRLVQGMSRRLGVKPSLATLLSVVTIATLLPTLVFGGWLFYRHAAQKRQADEHRLSELSSTVAAAVDREMRSWRETAVVAAASAPKSPDQFETFHAWASGLIGKVGGHFSLVDRTGQQLVDTRLPFGSILPKFSDEATLARVFATGQSLNSNLFMSRTAHRLIFDIHVPVKTGETVLFSLVYSPVLGNLQDIVAQQTLPSGWVAAIVDGKGRIAARSGSADGTEVGAPVPTPLQDRMSSGAQSLLEPAELAGRPCLVAYTQAPNTGWRGLVWVPLDVLETPSSTVRMAGLMFLAGIVLLSTGSAVLTSSLIRRPMNLTTASALALTRGDPVVPRHTFMAETEVLSTALSDAYQAIEQRRLALEESERRAHQFANAAPAILWAASPEAMIWMSDRWYEYTGLPQSTPMQGWSRHFHPEDRRRIRRDWRQSMTHGTELRSHGRIRAKDGTYRWFQMQALPQRDDTGDISMWYGSAADIDDLERTRQSLAASEERLRLAQDIAGIGTVEWDLRHDRGSWSDTFATLVGLEVGGWADRSGQAVLADIAARMPRAEADRFAALREELGTQREFAHEFQLTSDDGSPRWVDLRGAIIQCNDGSMRLIAVARDITPRKINDLDSARFVTVAEASREAIIGTSLAGRIEVWNKAAQRLYGWKSDDIRGRSADLLDPPDVSTTIAALIARAASGETVGPIDVTHRTSAGRPVIVNLSIVPVRDPRGAVVAVSISASDIAERKQREAETRWIMRELSHRSKNLLAVVQSMAGQTARMTNGMEEFQKRFSDRLVALARSHDLLVKQEWRGAMMADLVTSQVLPFTGAELQGLVARGPVQVLKPEAAQAIGMALHELASNAAKHGALSTSTGTIEASWAISIDVETSKPTFTFVWREQGGPPLAEDARTTARGFGREIIERLTPAALRGSSTTQWTSEGMLWQLTVPLDNVAHVPEHRSNERGAFDFGTTSPELMQLYRVWSQLRTEGHLPSLGDLAASEIGRHGAVFVAVEVGDDVSEIRLLTIGGRLAEILGGTAPGVLATSPLGRALSRELVRCRQSAITVNPCYARIAADTVERHGSYEVLMVPVASEGLAVSHFVGMVLPIETVQDAGR